MREWNRKHRDALKPKKAGYNRKWRARHLQQQLPKERERSRKFRVANPELHRERIWESKLHSYGLTLDQYHALFEQQGERCAVCRIVILPMGRGTHIDHDHTTDKVRGLLCNECNLGLGKFKDRPDVLRAAATYLERHHA
jgi:hypothetical protein